jgi:energy-coupling factor transporter transmembrane protein EcfT
MSDWMEHDLPNTSPTEGWNTMTPHEHTQVIMMFVILLVSFLLRNTPLGFMWRWIKIFVFVLIVTLLADHIKKSVKEWWKS